MRNGSPATFLLMWALVSGCQSSPTTSPTGLGDRSQPPDMASAASALSPDATCGLLLDCISHAAPNQFAALLQSYGNDGTCWQTPGAAPACHAACQQALTQAENGGLCCESSTQCRDPRPYCDLSAHVCAKCALGCCSNADCPNSARICEPTTHSCVQCVASSDCNDPFQVCNPQTHRCGYCITDADCHSADAPHCASGDCVGCTSAADCGGLDCINFACRCSANTQCATGHCGGNGQCCTPTFSCKPGDCSMHYDVGCSKDVDCGSCAVGACYQPGTCSNAGHRCTPGGSDCAPGDKCLPTWSEHEYYCAKDVTGQRCSGSSDNCTFLASADAFFCQSTSGCTPYCVTAADCAAGQTCAPLVDNPPTLRYPGYCK